MAIFEIFELALKSHRLLLHVIGSLG